jgi:hypothetical protein
LLQQDKSGEKWKKEKHFLILMQEMGVKSQNGGPHLLVLYFQRAGRMQVVKDNGFGWLD